MLRIVGFKCFRARVAGSINALRHIGLLSFLALATTLGTTLAVAQEGQPVPKTRAQKQATAAPVAGPPAGPAGAGAGAVQADESTMGEALYEERSDGQ